MSENTELEISNYRDLSQDIENMNAGKVAIYATIDMSDFDGRLEVAEALGNSTPLAEHYNEEFNLRDIVVQEVEIPNLQTGEVNKAPRVTLIHDDGTIYHATSVGTFSSLRALFGLVGTPDKWPGHVLRVKAVQERTRSGFNVTIIKPVRTAAKGK